MASAQMQSTYSTENNAMIDTGPVNMVSEGAGNAISASSIEVKNLQPLKTAKKR